jgi:hypothetical protein
MTVPAVSDAFFLHARHRSTTDERVGKRYGSSRCLHVGHTKPPGQRTSSRYCWHAASFGKTL